jgi:Arc/MetJ-type ribon-helix-helix transcriptional regulator
MKNASETKRIALREILKLKKDGGSREDALALAKLSAGHPVTIGPNLIVTVRIPHALSDRIDAWADQGTSRSAAIRQLIEAGLKRKRPVQR